MPRHWSLKLPANNILSPSYIFVFLSYQVAHGFDTGSAPPENLTLAERKRRALEGTPVQDDPCLKRQKSWLERGNETSQSSTSYRPKTIHRIASKNFVSYLDNQLRQSTPLPGLVYFKKDTRLEQWRDWRTWPHARLNIDMGSDQLTGSSALERMYELNISTLADFDHGAQRAVLEVLK